MSTLKLYIKTLSEELSDKELTPFERSRQVEIINWLIELKELRYAYGNACDKISDSLTCCEDCPYWTDCVNEDCVQAVMDHFRNE